MDPIEYFLLARLVEKTLLFLCDVLSEQIPQLHLVPGIFEGSSDVDFSCAECSIASWLRNPCGSSVNYEEWSALSSLESWDVPWHVFI